MPGFAIIPAEVFALKNAYAIAVYAVLAKHANSASECWPAIDRIATAVGVSRSTVKRALDALEEAGVVTSEEQWFRGMKQPNKYRLCFQNTANVQTVPTEPSMVPTEPLDGSHRTLRRSSQNHKLEPIEQDSKEQENVSPKRDASKPPRAKKPPHPNTNAIKAAFVTVSGAPIIDHAKSGQLAKQLAEGDMTPEQVPILYRWLMANDWYRQRGVDLGTMVQAYTRWVGLGCPDADGAETVRKSAGPPHYGLDRSDPAYRGSAGRDKWDADLAAAKAAYEQGGGR